MRSLVYLGSPYSHPDPVVQEKRFKDACLAASHLMRAGLHIFSPIAHTHPIALAGSLPGDWEYWQKYDEAVLQVCRSLAVLEPSGWEDSKGLAGEIKIAKRLDLPVHYSRPDPSCLDRLALVLRRDVDQQS